LGVVHALIRMALDCGWLDARARLLPLASSWTSGRGRRGHPSRRRARRAAPV